MIETVTIHLEYVVGCFNSFIHAVVSGLPSCIVSVVDNSYHWTLAYQCDAT